MKETAKKPAINEEFREQLRGMYPLDADTKYTVTPESFEKLPEELRPVFTLIPLTQGDFLLLKRMMLKDIQDTKSKSIKQAQSREDEYYGVLNKVLVGWENVLNPTTLEAREYDGKVETLKECLFESTLQELLKEALEMAGLKFE